MFIKQNHIGHSCMANSSKTRDATTEGPKYRH